MDIIVADIFRLEYDMTIDHNGFPSGDHGADERLVRPRYDADRAPDRAKPRTAIGSAFGFGGWGPKLG